jgi:hypothetical protein
MMALFNAMSAEGMMWPMILTLALAGLLAASSASDDLYVLALGSAVGAVIGFAVYDIPRRATAALLHTFAGPPPFIRYFADLVRSFAGVMARIALVGTIIISAIFLLALWKLGGYEQTTIVAKAAACFGSSYAFFSCLFGLFVALFIDDQWFGQAQKFRPNLAFGLFVGLIVPSLYLLNDVVPIVRKSFGL